MSEGSSDGSPTRLRDKSQSTPVINTPTREAAGTPGKSQTMRVYAGSALVSPGSLYKAVRATPAMSTQEVIADVLKRYGEPEDPSLFELIWAPSQEDGSPLKRSSMRRVKDRQPRILDSDECPVLVAEWFSETPRRFELHRKGTPDSTTPSKRWSTPNLFGSRRKSQAEGHIYAIDRNISEEGSPSPSKASSDGEDSPAKTTQQMQQKTARRISQQLAEIKLGDDAKAVADVQPAVLAEADESIEAAEAEAAAAAAAGDADKVAATAANPTATTTATATATPADGGVANGKPPLVSRKSATSSAYATISSV